MIRTMAVVGTGLIGTSVALAAARRDVTVYLSDRDEFAARTAELLGAGLPGPPPFPVDLAVLAVPPSRTAAVLAQQQSRGLALAYTDVASVKSAALREALSGAPEPSRYVGGHPLAGRERSGPLAARAELFEGRPWVLTPTRLTSKAAFDRALDLIDLCGAVPLVMRGEAHDDAVALTSHAPHVVASLMAARLRDCPPEAARLAGQGLRDVTRIARGDSGLWSDIISSNAAAVARVLTDLQEDLTGVLAALHDLAAEPPHAGPGAPGGPDAPRGLRALGDLGDLLDRGIAGVGEVSDVRHGQPERSARVRVAIPDRSGELSRLLSAAAGLGVGAEDAAVGAAPAGRGGLLVRLAVSARDAGPLVDRLSAEGWAAEHDGGGPNGGLPAASPAASSAASAAARRAPEPLR